MVVSFGMVAGEGCMGASPKLSEASGQGPLDTRMLVLHHSLIRVWLNRAAERTMGKRSVHRTTTHLRAAGRLRARRWDVTFSFLSRRWGQPR